MTTACSDLILRRPYTACMRLENCSHTMLPICLTTTRRGTPTGLRDSDKLLIQLPEWRDGARPLMMPLRAILLPCVTGLRNTSIEESSPAAALRALAPSTIILSPSTGGENLRQRLGRPFHSATLPGLKTRH